MKPIIYRGKSLMQWSKETGIPYSTIVSRYHAGHRGKKLFSEKPLETRRAKKHDFYGKSLTIQEIATQEGCSYVHAMTLLKRCQEGEPYRPINSHLVRRIVIDGITYRKCTDCGELYEEKYPVSYCNQCRRKRVIASRKGLTKRKPAAAKPPKQKPVIPQDQFEDEHVPGLFSGCSPEQIAALESGDLNALMRTS